MSSGRAHAPSIHEVAVGSISPNRLQPRKRFDPRTLAELTASIREKGITTPVIVRRAGGGYELIAGERRWRAARQAGLKTVPALVREASDREALELALVENLQREDLNPMEEAASYQLLLKEMTQEELARRIGKDRATVANTVRLLKLPREIQEAVGTGAISAGHARAVLSLESPSDQVALFRRIVRGSLSVRQTEDAAARHGHPRGRGTPAARHTNEELSRALGTKVYLKRRGKRGRIVIEFYSEEELERLMGILSRHGR
jgi:ParB family chromosome partitioning protein